MEDGMYKELTFETSTNKGVFLYTLGEGRDHGYLTKTAGAGDFHPEIANYINNCKSIPGQIQVLLTALGAGEYWGSNINGDFFPAEALRHRGEDYGHKTFESMAHVYKHHINKDPAKSYGKVILSVWNERMKRVELIVTIEESKAPDLVERVNNGEYPEVSMGCKVPYDVCSVCGNKAKTRKDYCDHLRYHINKIPPGHSKIATAINTIPKFFDISFVLIGADRIAKVMKKVAHNRGTSNHHPLFGVSSAQIAEQGTMDKTAAPNSFKQDFLKTAGPRLGLSKRADHRKKAEIEKEIPSNLDGNTVGNIVDLANKGPEALRPLEPDMDKKVIIHIGDAHRGMPGLSKVISTLLTLGVLPKPHEFQNIALRCLGKKELADEYSRLNLTFDPEGKISKDQECSCERHLDIDPKNFSNTVFRLVEPDLADRSYARPLLAKRVVRLVKLAEQGKLKYPRDEHVKVASEEESGKIGLLPMMATLTGLYMAMKNKFPTQGAKGLDKFLLDHPAAAAALGIGGVAAADAMFGRTVKGKYDFNPDEGPIEMGTWQEEIERKNMNPLAKTAQAPGSIAKRLFFGVPALYLASGMQEVKRARNPYEQEGALGSFIRKHPDVASAALVGEGLAGFPLTKKLKGLAGSGLKFLRKTGSISDEALSTAVFSLAFPGTSSAVRSAMTAVDHGIISGIEKLLSNKRKTQGGMNAKY